MGISIMNNFNSDLLLELDNIKQPGNDTTYTSNKSSPWRLYVNKSTDIDILKSTEQLLAKFEEEKNRTDTSISQNDTYFGISGMSVTPSKMREVKEWERQNLLSMNTHDMGLVKSQRDQRASNEDLMMLSQSGMSVFNNTRQVRDKGDRSKNQRDMNNNMNNVNSKNN